MNIAAFNADLELFAKAAGIELEQAVRTIAIDAHNRVTTKTPVRTGRARGNWNVKAGSPDLTINESVAGSQTPSLKKGDGNGPIYITNSLPYIQKLEDGHSKQAPAGMVLTTIAELDAGISNVIR